MLLVIWLIGLSGAGKTTIGRHLYEMWKAEEKNTVFVDGDEIRALFKDDHPGSYTLEARRRNAERITGLCAWLDRQDINVVCCILSLFPDMRSKNRELFSNYFESYIEAPLDVLIQRDSKGLYAAAVAGKTKNVVGVDIEFIPPASPDIVLNTGRDNSDPFQMATRIFTAAVKPSGR